MPASLPPSKILVTGANGFIAVWVVKLLLERGYAVRGTSRTEEKNGRLRELFGKYVEEGKLELTVVEDITKVAWHFNHETVVQFFDLCNDIGWCV